MSQLQLRDNPSQNVEDHYVKAVHHNFVVDGFFLISRSRIRTFAGFRNTPIASWTKG